MNTNVSPLSIHEIRTMVEFIDKRFPDAHTNYRKVWAERFAQRKAWSRCDNTSKKVLGEIAGLWGVDPKGL